MLHSNDAVHNTVTGSIQRSGVGTFELVRTSEDGHTVYFDQPKDAIRRWNTWVLESSYRLHDPEELLAKLVECHAPQVINGSVTVDVDTTLPLASSPVRGRLVCVGDSIDLGRSGLENRAAARVRPEEVPWLLGVRILYGDRVPVINISHDGILFETRRELVGGVTIPIELFGKKGALPVASRVIRSRRFVQGDIEWFETACQFKRSVDIEHLAPRFRNTGRMVSFRDAHR